MEELDPGAQVPASHAFEKPPEQRKCACLDAAVSADRVAVEGCSERRHVGGQYFGGGQSTDHVAVEAYLLNGLV